MLGGQDLFQWYEYIVVLFILSIGTTDIMIKEEASINFTKQALLDRTKAVQALNESMTDSCRCMAKTTTIL